MRSISFLILIGLCHLTWAQTMGKQTLAQLEESPAGAKILQFIDAVNSGEEVSEVTIKKLFAPKLIEKMGMEDLINSTTDLQSNEGTLSVYMARRQKVTQYKLKVKGKKSNEWFEMLFFFEDAEPYRMAGYTIDSIDDDGRLNEPLYPKTK